MMDFKGLFRSVDVLMVDDVQFIAGKDSTQDEFFHTFNALIDQQKQIIISADRAPGEIDGLEERIRSRLQWGLVVDLHPTDYELRLASLQQKGRSQYRGQYQELKITDGCWKFLAQSQFQKRPRFEGALTPALSLGKSLVGAKFTLEWHRRASPIFCASPTARSQWTKSCARPAITTTYACPTYCRPSGPATSPVLAKWRCGWRSF
ncbi:UNVERIFIED_CONTAM: hypothetical protein GTU68_046637 [Idotea baltica]|nr:hypothetical protein [Idotea baltica]